jgi:hypothetical protein
MNEDEKEEADAVQYAIAVLDHMLDLQPQACL